MPLVTARAPTRRNHATSASIMNTPRENRSKRNTNSTNRTDRRHPERHPLDQRAELGGRHASPDLPVLPGRNTIPPPAARSRSAASARTAGRTRRSPPPGSADGTPRSRRRRAAPCRPGSRRPDVAARSRRSAAARSWPVASDVGFTGAAEHDADGDDHHARRGTPPRASGRSAAVPARSRATPRPTPERRG